ncbi:hypothetical protein B0H11DRAFT_2073568 [Mycena galericulata]|nr:hypothetical protein B0H11DRAFT_2073568 [Mycena galericulata]
MPLRSRRPPKLTRTAKASLEPDLHASIDAALKDLKTCARRLQPVLATFSEELQILHRLYYKGKNQHRPALFWRRVAEMRRYADRVEELSLLSLVDYLRYSFFGEELQQNSKLLKGSWTHYPNPSSVSFLLERIRGSLMLIHKMHGRLAHAYQSFVLAMQTGAFIQLILTLAGIASRMSSLAAELSEVLRLTWDAVNRILSTLDPGSTTRNLPRRMTLPDQSSAIHAVDIPTLFPSQLYDTTAEMPKELPRNYQLMFTRTPAFRLRTKIRMKSGPRSPYLNTHESSHGVERTNLTKRAAHNQV